MLCQELQEFLEHLDILGELQRVAVEVDPVLEISEITDRMSKSPGGRQGSALRAGERQPVPDRYQCFRLISACLRRFECSHLSDIDLHVTALLRQLPGTSLDEKISGLSRNPE